MTAITKFGKWYWFHILRGLGLEKGWRHFFLERRDLPFKEEMRQEWDRFKSMVVVIVVPQLFVLALLLLQVLIFLVAKQFYG